MKDNIYFVSLLSIFPVIQVGIYLIKNNIGEIIAVNKEILK